MDGAEYSGGVGVMDMIRKVTAEAIGMIGKWIVWLGAAACLVVAAASVEAQAPNPGIRKPPIQVNRPRPAPQAEPQAEEAPGREVPQPNQVRPTQQTQRPQQPQPPPPDRVSELLKRVDPAILARLAGADVTVEIIGDQVILHGPEEVVKTLELLIRGLDTEFQVKRKVVEIVQVSERDANEIAKSVESALRDALKKPNQLPEEQLKLTPLSSNILLVSALPEEIDLVLETITKLDSIPDPLGKIELMRFQVKYRKASDVSKELEKIITQLRQAQGGKKEQTKIQFIPNNSNNTITVTARESEREKIQSLLDNIDVEPVKGFGEVKLTIYPLVHSKAKELADVIDKLLKSQAQSQATKDAIEETFYRFIISRASPTGQITDLPPIDLQRTIKITPDDGTNSLIVATSEENVVPMGELIRLLDGVPLGSDVAVKLLPLRFAAAEKLADTIKKMFEEGKKLPEDPDGSGKDAVPETQRGKALVYNVSVVADVRTNTLVVSGREEQLALVEEIVAKLDQPATALKFPLRLIPIEFSDATGLGKMITELFDQRFKAAEAVGADKAALERERIFLSADIRSNSLILSASEENFTEIAGIVLQLDTRPAKLFDQIRILRCERLSANDLKKKIEDLWKRKAELRKESKLLEDIPVIAVDERSNALLVAANIEDFEEIQRLVKTLESQPLINDTQLFKIEFADVTVLSTQLDDLFKGMEGKSETFKAPTIIPDSRSNTLLVAAPLDTMDRVADVVKRLDVEAGPLTALFKVYPLKYGSASQIAQRMQKLFDSRKEGEKGSRTPIVILAEETSNSLVASASRDDQNVIDNLLGLLDRPSNIARQFEIFPLKMSKAATVAEKLDSLFKAQGGDAGGAGRADAIAVQADERTNSLIVWASPSQMINIADVIMRLDTAAPTVEMMVKVIQLRQALAEDFAKLLEETLIGENAGSDKEQAVIVSFLEKSPDGQETIRKLLRQDIKIKPDARTNSLMVMAPADSMAMLEAMIHDFDKIRPVTSEIRLFPLINSDAKTMVDQLKEIFQTEGGGGGAGGEKTQSQLVFGTSATDLEQLASVGQELRFAADARTNTLIVAGAQVYLTMVEDLVRFLDSQEAENRVSSVYNAKFSKASDLATAIKAFTEQETNVLGTGEDEESRVRRQERQISVESMGDAEKGSSSLLVGTSSRSYQRTMDLIQSLDRAEPQVMISVLIAEVSLTNDVDLGVEIAGQELDFSKDAVVGPNGVIEGGDFDYVGGDVLGAVGSGLGFTFTITGEDFSFLLRALQTDSRLEILSRPVLMVRNGEEGKITIADEVPIIQSSQVTDSGQINVTPGREEVGIILTATPHISPDGYVTIELIQEISNIGASIQLSEDFSQPIFAKREVNTNITIRDGETAIVGGLIQSKDSQSETKVPLLGDIPGLGTLFRTTSVKNSKTELLIALTVDVLRSDEDVHKMSIEQRDKFILPDSIRHSPLMEGLRITPQEAGLGPRESGGPGSGKATPQSQKPAAPPEDARDGREQYGPKPRIYGPPINKPNASSTTSVPFYGPVIAKGAIDPKTDE
jgi:type II secretion system protein D